MTHKKRMGVGLSWGKSSFLIITATALSIGCSKNPINEKDLKDFKQINLVSNVDEYKPLRPLDPTLQNGFGIAWSPSGVAWVNSVLGHVSDLYDAEGFIKRTPVNIPSSTDPLAGGFPCGIVFNGSQGFKLANGNPSVFMFSSFDGVISAWNGGNNATRIKQPFNEHTSYTGLAIAQNNGHTLIYAANFGEKKINVWDSTFAPVSLSFKDANIPSDYSPYNIQAVGDYLFVMYAKLGTDADGALKGHGVPGRGNGFVDAFYPDGTLAKRFAARGTLNVPWGVTAAPGSFLEDKDMGNDGNNGHDGYGDNYSGGNNSNHNPKDPVLLVGNFGDGRINVYSMDGKFLGQLQSNKHPITIEGLWALTFGPASVDQARLYFSAGPDGEANGIFGYLIKQ